VTTTTILGDVVGAIVGDAATVTVLLPLGADPHDYQASALQVAEMRSADLVVANGLHLEAGLDDILDTLAADGARVYRVAEHLDPLPFGDSGGDLDPHVWLDPLRMAEAARQIAVELEAVAPGIDWAARADAYGAALLQTDAEIRTILDVVPADRRKLVTSHDAFGYFAARYGFEVIGTVVPGASTLAEPSSAALAGLLATIDAEGISAIFVGTTESAILAETLAAETGGAVEVVGLFTGSLGAAGSGAETLIDMLLTNAERIAGALS
jgi:zinc/manganese transport system substrate-binding protein